LGVIVLCFVFAAKAAAAPSLFQNTLGSQTPAWLNGPLDGILSAPDKQAVAALTNFGLPAMFLFYCLAVLGSGRLRTRYVFGLTVVAQLITVAGPSPYGTDQFIYLEFSRMWAVLHLNPYLNAVFSAPHVGSFYHWAVWPGARSPYGPLFTVLLAPISTLSFGAAYWASRLLILATILGSVWLCGVCAAEVGASRQRTIAFVGLNPLILFYCVGGSHNDVTAALPLLGAMLLALRSARLASSGSSGSALDTNRPMAAASYAFAAGVLLSVGAGMKASVLVCVPALVLATERRAEAIAGLILGGLGVWAVTVLCFGGYLPDLGSQSQFIDPQSFPSMIGTAVGLGGETAALRMAFEVLLLAAVVTTGVISWRVPRAMADCVTWAALALVASISWQEPWYAILFLVPASCSRSRGLKVLCAGISLVMLLSYLPDGRWLAGSTNPLALLHINQLVASQS
jgi:hypothetical protein